MKTAYLLGFLLALSLVGALGAVEDNVMKHLTPTSKLRVGIAYPARAQIASFDFVSRLISG
jgi:hypothetical protein